MFGFEFDGDVAREDNFDFAYVGANYVYRSNDAKTHTLLLSLATVMLTIAVARDFRKRKR